MKQIFLEHGYELADFDENADIFVVNTCTVTNISDKKSRQMLRKVKQKNPNSVVVAVGCYAQVAKNDLEKIEEIDIVLGNNEKKRIIEYVEEYINANNINKISDISKIEDSEEFLEFGQVIHIETSRALIKIQDGCNNFCSYCIIPYARGRIRSRSKDAILSEVRKIVELGIKEVVLTGIHVASYGKENAKKDSGYYLIDLIEDINKVDGIERIRLSSIEPCIITEEFCERLSKVEKICEHFHLSLQSGCDKTLKQMNRKYTTEEFRKSVEILRKTFKNVNLTTDLIVGFPGETDDDFNETYKFLEEIRFFKIHVFKYSKRNGTVAAKMPNQVDEKIKEERSRKVIELSNRIEKEYLEKYVGNEIQVLFEEEKNGLWRGHSKNYVVVNVKSEEDLKNSMINIEITGVKDLELVGKIKK